MKRSIWLVLFFLWIPEMTIAQTAPSGESACISCHGDPEIMGEEGEQLVAAFRQDVHLELGLSCHDCHGGNPDPSLSDDLEASMSENWSPNPFRGNPERGEIPSFCGECHSDPIYMRRFNPSARIDQESEYWTSKHGEALKQGDTKVATCTECHGVHGILRSNNPRSSVYPTNVALTCRTCHDDPERMAGYTGPHGNPVRIDQYARWRQSVHATALFEKQDLSAPTCNDCHGNHGASPPGLESLAYVCGQCHGRESELFRASSKHGALQIHSEFLAEAAGEGCAACHESKPLAELPISHSFGECSSCHGNHGVVRPTTSMIAPPPEAPCSFCHELSDELLEEYPELKDAQSRYTLTKLGLLQQARVQGLEGDDLYDWFVDRTLELPNHTVPGDADEEGPPSLRPEFAELFQKFRIGKTFFTYSDPTTGQLTRASVVRCSHCHAADEDSTGLKTGEDFLEQMQQLTALSAAAERSLLRARRAGMETREGMLDVDHAVDAQIALAALIHTFSLEEGFSETQQEGINYARAALLNGRTANEELQTRRLGLLTALFFVILVLIGLALKIRDVSRREVELHS